MIAIAGCGNIARLHAKLLRPHTDLYFYSKNFESADRFNRKYKGAGTFGSFEALLKDARIKGVVLCTPPDAHRSQVESALEAGKYVLCEKPLCVRSEDLVALSKIQTGRLMIAENYYYKPALKTLKSWLKIPSLGQIKRIRIGKRSEQIPLNWKSSYGALLEGGIHFVAFLNSLLEGHDFKITSSLFPRVASGRPERTSVLTFQVGARAEAELSYSWEEAHLLKGLFQRSQIECENGSIYFENNGLYGKLITPIDNKRFLALKDPMGYNAQAEDFLRWINSEGARAPLSHFANAKKDLEIIFEAYKMGGLTEQGALGGLATYEHPGSVHSGHSGQP